MAGGAQGGGDHPTRIVEMMPHAAVTDAAVFVANRLEADAVACLAALLQEFVRIGEFAHIPAVVEARQQRPLPLRPGAAVGQGGRLPVVAQMREDRQESAAAWARPA